MGEERYKFKWSNVDLDDFARGRKFIASDLRAQSKILIARADQIDEETYALQAALEIPDDE